MMKSNKTTCYSIFIGVVLLGIVLAACDNEKNKTFTVGVINTSVFFEQNIVGFKEGMMELGYIEGENIRYVYDGPTQDVSKLPEAAKTLVTKRVDLILSVTTPTTKIVKQATAGLELPVVFSSVTDPVGAGIVESMQNPGGNITGVAFGIQEARRFEWLVQIAPEIRKVYAPYNPNDQSPVLALEAARKAAGKLGVELITREVYNQETLDDAVTNIPAEADAVFILPDSYIGTRFTDFVTTSTNLKLPTSVANISVVQSLDILTAYGYDQHSSGKQAARLADQIFKGTRPADLPVEMAEFYLAINLNVAETIGLTIPDEILRQADVIVR